MALNAGPVLREAFTMRVFVDPVGKRRAAIIAHPCVLCWGGGRVVFVAVELGDAHEVVADGYKACGGLVVGVAVLSICRSPYGPKTRPESFVWIKYAPFSIAYVAPRAFSPEYVAGGTVRPASRW